MAFSINPDHLPVLRNYEEAKRQYNGTAQIRGKTIRPLGKRSAQHMTILETKQDGVNAYACRLYNTNVVTYLEDGRIHLNHDGYTTRSTTAFADRILAHGRVSSSGKSTLLYTCKQGVFVIPSGGIYLDANGSVIDPTPVIVHKINRKTMSALRKQYGTFTRYVRAISLLRDELHASEELANRIPHGAFMEAVNGEDTAQWYQAYRSLLSLVRYSSTFRWSDRRPDGICRIALTSILRQFESILLKHYSEEVLVEEVLPVGQWKKDTYASYI